MTGGRLAARVAIGLWLVTAAVGVQAKSKTIREPPEQEANPASLIRQYDAMPKTSTAAEFDRFIAANRALLTESEAPYGPALLWSLQFSRSEAAMALLRAGAAVPEGAVTLAAQSGLDDLVSLLMARGVKGADRDAALLAAAKYGQESTLRLLLNMGADVNTAAAHDGFTPLHLAVMNRHLGSIRILLSANAKLEAKDRKGQTPLHWGPFAYRMMEAHIYQKLQQPHDTVYVDPGEAEAITFLLDAGANMEATDEDGNTALHHAAILDSGRAAELLMSRGASPTAKNRRGQTPKSIAKDKGSKDLIQILNRKPKATPKSGT